MPGRRPTPFRHLESLLTSSLMGLARPDITESGIAVLEQTMPQGEDGHVGRGLNRVVW